MPLLIALLALFIPRITILALYFLTNWFDAVFKTVLWPVLGFVFMPVTMLWYSVVYHWFGGHWDVVTLAGLVIAVIIDVAPSGIGRRRRRVVTVEEV
ncbi:MAG TPA: hypothetical protein VGE41_09395 [Verrucomicrobiae bacterium]|jgi:hypothetical protein